MEQRIEVLRDLANFNLFWSHGNPVNPIEKITDRTIIIDVHAMPVLKELGGYLVMERLYKEKTTLPDSPVKDGKRTLRTISGNQPEQYQNGRICKVRG
jgi:DNA sulfur modification protein DndE